LANNAYSLSWKETGVDVDTSGDKCSIRATAKLTQSCGAPLKIHEQIILSQLYTICWIEARFGGLFLYSSASLPRSSWRDRRIICITSSDNEHCVFRECSPKAGSHVVAGSNTAVATNPASDRHELA
jgi:hypothetical protein